MSSEVAINVKNVKKSFKLPVEATKSLRSTLVNTFRGIRGYRKQEVLKDISFKVNKGDFFGIVGRNGSGKSTLLKIISQIYVPESGSVTVNGSLSSFIELGVGFNEELTGRENVYLNGAMLGFSKSEIDEMYNSIVAFAELQDFMDQKLKNYSSGMQVRLSFSIAIQTNADILILDEVLAVGDEDFQRKCRDYFKKVRKEGKTVILVTHDMGAVREYCNKAMLIEKGEVVEYSDDVDKVAYCYSELFNPGGWSAADPMRMGNKKITFQSQKHQFDAQKHTISCQIKNQTNETQEDFSFGINFYHDGNDVAGSQIQHLTLKPNEVKEIEIELENRFGNGIFTIDLSLISDRGREINDLIRVAFEFENIYGKINNSTYELPIKHKNIDKEIL
jgi:ABC-type polysaccharide/polyol phosphate transport system ATPase subunit